MKNIILTFFKIALVTCFFSCANKIFLKQGIISYQTYFTDYDSLTRLPLFNTSENRIWFKDSSVIYEIKIIKIKTDHTPKGTFEKTTFDLLKYTYLDLRTMRCQDYFSLKDTALPLDNYILKPGEGFGWEFFTAKNSNDTIGIRSTLPDTIIDNKVYGRIKIRNHPDTSGYDYEYYLDCNLKNNMFHLNPTLDEMYPKCKVVRYVLKSKDDPFTTIVNTKIISDTLSKVEVAVFTKWGHNAITTKLPVINSKEANKLTLNSQHD